MNAEPKWLIIPTSITGSINFNEVLETGVDTLRLSIDGSKTFVKYYTNEVTASYQVPLPDPDTGETEYETIQAGIYGRPSIYLSEYPEYDYQTILEVLNTPEWS